MNMLSIEDLNLAGEFRSALRQAVYFTRRMDADGKLSAAQLSLLNMLADDGLRVSAIAANLGVRMPSATESITRLAQAGLVERCADPSDSRVVVVRLTEQGRATAQAVNHQRSQVIARALSQLTPDEQNTLREAIPVMNRLNEIFGSIQAPAGR
ncbi:MarR family winged helix-turn-helix transcriptional regulator [Psychromicrobium xiongbiense]|uniref:MarR family winged helix-turn-helix transcriptional regulator n=1 Tax=Psychromicrobium xiongbiense TaxID=3051184 RepID=UPI002553D2B1|nr:MarR family transcriptional regulator [Psychromicrobium sp. YIM S02556]